MTQALSTMMAARPQTKYCLLGLALAACLLNACQIPKDTAATPAQTQASGNSEASSQHAPVQARNVILFLGDGMGISTVTAARIFAGQQQGLAGEEYELSFERFPQVALSKTYNSDQQVPDSAGTMSAITTGTKTRAGVIAMQAEPRRGRCGEGLGLAATTILELAELSGLSTGVVSTARITHATPAATYAHAAERGWEDDSALSKEARASGCKDIARQLLEFPFGDGPEVVLGGGRRAFWPASLADVEYPEKNGHRQDGRNLTQEWLQHRPGSQYVWNLEGFRAALEHGDGPLLGLFEPGHMQYEHDRPKDPGGEPSLSEMTQAAISRLQGTQQPYFLMVEGGRIDHAHHVGNAYRALSEAVSFADAVATAVAMTDPAETLIVVTADHSHVFTMAGYPRRGNPILGLARAHDAHDQPAIEPLKGDDGLPYTTLAYSNGPGYRPDGRSELSDHTTQDPDFLQPASVPLESETHGGEDVAIYAQGPGAEEIHGVMEQNRIFFAMIKAQPQLQAQWQAIESKLGWPIDPAAVLDWSTGNRTVQQK